MNVKTIAYGAFLIGCLLLTVGADQPERQHEVKLVSEVYTVHTGDTIDGIAQQYIKRNTGTRQDFQEFREGILELNYDTLKDRPSHCIIYPGDQIQVNYWVQE